MAAMKYCVVLVLLYSIPVRATTTRTVFHTNCTRPPPGSIFNFVSAPNTRGTSEILWSCLFTLFICTWRVQHLNVPPPDRITDGPVRTRLFWMLMTLVGPELLVGIALKDFIDAWRSLKHMQREFPELVERGDWKLTHSFYANMYGFRVRRRRAVAEPELATTPISRDPSELLVLDTRRMITYLKSMPDFVMVKEEDILSRAKGDFVAKGIGAAQLLRFAFQVVARIVQNLRVSQLEIAVMGFAVCTFVSYLFWLKKPQDVSIPTVFDEGPEPLPISDDWFDSRENYSTDPFQGTQNYTPLNLLFGLKLDIVVAGFVVGGTIFGAVHLTAWNLHFPTLNDRIVWRLGSLATTAIPLWYLPLVFTAGAQETTHVPNLYGTPAVAQIIWWGPYFVVRFALVVEALRSLWYLPAGAFATPTWTIEIPQVM